MARRDRSRSEESNTGWEPKYDSESMEQRKKKYLDELAAIEASIRAEREALRERVRICAESPTGHVYSNNYHYQHCVGCGIRQS